VYDIYAVETLSESLPDGVYIAGIIKITDGEITGYHNGYWTGDQQVVFKTKTLDDPKTILASDGKVLVDCRTYYWVDEKIFQRSYFDFVTISDGNITHFKGLNFINQTYFIPRAYTVSDGKIYIAGNTDFDNYLGYYIDNEKHIIESSPEKFPTAIAVGKNASLHIAGWKNNSRYCWYYTDGNFTKLAEESITIKRIMFYENKVYCFPDFGSNCYWIDNNKVTLSLPDNAKVYDYFIAQDGAIYMAGCYMLVGEDGFYTAQACYWINNERFDLPEGYRATAIFVEE